MVRLVLLGTSFALTLVILATSASAAAPRLIAIKGAGLCEQVVIDNWDEAAALFSAFAGSNSSQSIHVFTGPDALRMSYLEMGLFWGPEWAKYIEEGRSVTGLSLEQANQFARFYPSDSGLPAFVEYPTTLSSRKLQGPLQALAADAVEILRRHGVPVTVEELAASPCSPSSPSSSSPPWPWIIAASSSGTLALIALGGTIAVRRRKTHV